MFPSQPGSQEIDSMEKVIALLDAGDPHSALDLCNRTIHADPTNPMVHYNAGVASQTVGDTHQAISFYQTAIGLLPSFNQAYHNLAQAYSDQGQALKAIEAYRQALQVSSSDYKSAYNLSLLYRQVGNDQAAIQACQQALKANPDYAEAFSTLGLMYTECLRFAEAQVCLEQALAIRADFPEAYFNMGVLFQKCGRYQQGLSSYQNALSCDPAYAPARWLSLLSLPMLYDSEDQIRRCRRQFSQNLERLIQTTALDSDVQRLQALQGIQTTTNFYLQYQGGNDLVLQSRYGTFVHRVMKANYPQWTRPRTMPPLATGDKIRVGYVSSFMCRHTIGTFLSGWVENHSRSKFDIHCYHVGRKTDSMTEHFARIADRFHHFAGDVEAAARRIDQDQLHVLVYSDIGMDPTTLQLAALRLAPIQCKGWGHPVTTGLPTIDHYLSSDLMEPDDAGQHYSEGLVRLPNLALCYQKPDLPNPPKSPQELGLPDNRFIYLSTQSIFKYLPQYDAVMAQIALKVPQACFVFLSNQSRLATEQFRQRLTKAFRKYGLEADQFCHFSPRLNYEDFLNLNLAADVMLDTFEWSGGKTTLEALSCGLPVVTSPGRFMRGRHAYAMLAMIGLQETIASTKTDYIQIAARLALDPNFYRGVKQKVLKGAHQLYNDQYFIAQLEQFYEDTVQTHVN